MGTNLQESSKSSYLELGLKIDPPRSSPLLIQASFKVHKLATMKGKKKKKSNLKLKEVWEKNLERERGKYPTFLLLQAQHKGCCEGDEGVI